MDTLKKIVKTEVAKYAVEGLNGIGYLVCNEAQNVFAVIDIGEFQGKRFVHTGLLVRIIGNTVVIEQDLNNKPLYEALVQAGIPRSQIVLAYAGEKLEEVPLA